MNESRRCPVCGAEIPEGSPEGLCPRCVMQAGIASDVGKAESAATAPFTPVGRFAAPPLETLARLFPHLEILALLGQGGMGAVYKARQPGLDRLVALKILPPEVGADPAFAERFQREARALARLNHPNILAVYDFGRAKAPVTDAPGSPSDLFYFVMEYVDGVNLRQAMRQGKLQPAEALRIVPQICDALQFAHDEGIVHRDIKPENILLDKRGRVKIADFGLAKLLGVKGDHALTGTQQVMGTPHYMAPEQIQGARDVDHRADIYSLGVTFYEMLTGELPLGRFAPPSKKVAIDVRVDDVVLRTLEREPELRYQHASDVKTEVETISGVAPVALQRVFGKEYRSKTTLFGLPLLHIVSGLDPKTGRTRVAKGIFAFGDIAVGLVAVGGLATGGIAFGGLAIGVVSFGGFALALAAALGGVAVGGFAFGGLAVGGVALGGGAVGYFAAGGGGFGIHGWFGEHGDPEAIDFFRAWAFNWPAWVTWIGIGSPILASAAWGFMWIVLRSQAKQRRPESTPPPFSSWESQPKSGAFPAAPPGSPRAALEQTIAALLPDDRIAAIRVYREATGAGLAEAMAAVRLIAQRHDKDRAVPFSWENLLWALVWAVAMIAAGFWLAETQPNAANKLMFRLGGFVAALFAIAMQISAQRKRSRWSLEDLEEEETAGKKPPKEQ